jgi:hypothetical protein
MLSFEQLKKIYIFMGSGGGVLCMTDNYEELHVRCLSYFEKQQLC